MCTIWSLFSPLLLNLKSNMRLFCSHMRRFPVASGDITAVHSLIKSFVLGPLCCRIKRRNPKQICERALAVVKELVPTTASLFLCFGGTSDWVHSSCTLSIERSDLLACQGKHCSRKQSKSTYLAPLKLLLFYWLICVTPMERLAKSLMRHIMMINEFTALLLIKRL